MQRKKKIPKKQLGGVIGAGAVALGMGLGMSYLTSPPIEAKANTVLKAKDVYESKANWGTKANKLASWTNPKSHKLVYEGYPNLKFSKGKLKIQGWSAIGGYATHTRSNQTTMFVLDEFKVNDDYKKKPTSRKFVDKDSGRQGQRFVYTTQQYKTWNGTSDFHYINGKPATTCSERVAKGIWHDKDGTENLPPKKCLRKYYAVGYGLNINLNNLIYKNAPMAYQMYIVKQVRWNNNTKDKNKQSTVWDEFVMPVWNSKAQEKMYLERKHKYKGTVRLGNTSRKVDVEGLIYFDSGIDTETRYKINSLEVMRLYKGRPNASRPAKRYPLKCNYEETRCGSYSYEPRYFTKADGNPNATGALGRKGRYNASTYSSDYTLRSTYKGNVDGEYLTSYYGMKTNFKNSASSSKDKSVRFTKSTYVYYGGEQASIRYVPTVEKDMTLNVKFKYVNEQGREIGVKSGYVKGTYTDKKTNESRAVKLKNKVFEKDTSVKATHTAPEIIKEGKTTYKLFNPSNTFKFKNYTKSAEETFVFEYRKLPAEPPKPARLIGYGKWWYEKDTIGKAGIITRVNKQTYLHKDTDLAPYYPDVAKQMEAHGASRNYRYQTFIEKDLYINNGSKVMYEWKKLPEDQAGKDVKYRVNYKYDYTDTKTYYNCGTWESPSTCSYWDWAYQQTYNKDQEVTLRIEADYKNSVNISETDGSLTNEIGRRFDIFGNNRTEKEYDEIFSLPSTEDKSLLTQSSVQLLTSKVDYYNNLPKDMGGNKGLHVTQENTITKINVPDLDLNLRTKYPKEGAGYRLPLYMSQYHRNGMTLNLGETMYPSKYTGFMVTVPRNDGIRYLTEGSDASDHAYYVAENDAGKYDGKLAEIENRNLEKYMKTLNKGYVSTATTQARTEYPNFVRSLNSLDGKTGREIPQYNDTIIDNYKISDRYFLPIDRRSVLKPNDSYTMTGSFGYLGVSDTTFTFDQTFEYERYLLGSVYDDTWIIEQNESPYYIPKEKENVYNQIDITQKKGYELNEATKKRSSLLYGFRSSDGIEYYNKVKGN